MDASREFRVVLLGTTSVGKTTLFNRMDTKYVANDEESEVPTVKAAYIQREVRTKNGIVKLAIWDTAGQERFRSLIPMYTRDSDLAIIMFSVDMPESAENLDQWLNLLAASDCVDCIVYVVANKIDLEDHCALEIGRAWAQKNDFTFLEVSALQQSGVEDLLIRISDDLQKLPKFEDIHDRKFEGIAELSSQKGNDNGGCC